MSILMLLNRVNSKYLKPPHPVVSKELSLKRSYLLGIAMQAHSDEELDASEQNLLLNLAKAFGVSQETALEILREAGNPSEKTVLRIRENLMHAKDKYYFILDLRIMAHQDQKLMRVESQVIDQFARLLAIESEDVAFLKELADAVVEKDMEARSQWLQEFLGQIRISRNAAPEDFAHYTSDQNFRVETGKETS